MLVLVMSISSVAEDQKPYKGWANRISTVFGELDEIIEGSYLDSVIDSLGPPIYFPYVAYMTFYGINNVGGSSIHDNMALFYLNFSDFPNLFWDFYEDQTITVANGDRIFVTVVGTCNFDFSYCTSTDTVVDGTGRFDNAEGEMEVTPGLIKGDLEVVVFDGWITTVGSAKEE